MRLSLLCLLMFWLPSFVQGQDHFNTFKSLEKQVKYSNPDSLLFFANTLDTSSLRQKAIKSWAKGKAFYWNSDYPKAYLQLEKALKFVEQLKDTNLLGEIYLDLSSSLAVVDNNGKALSYMLKAIDIFEEVGSVEQRGRSKISLGELYRKIGNHSKAKEVLRSALPNTNAFSYQRARCLNRLAAVCSETGMLDSSLYYSYGSLEIANSIGDPDLIATCENEIGYVLRLQNKFQESLPHFMKADSLWRSVGMLRYASNPIHHAAVVYRSIGEVEKGLYITHKAYAMTNGKGWYQIEMNQLDDLKAMHDLLRNEDSVLYYDRERLQAAINFRTKQYEVNTKMVEALYTQKENEQTIREQRIELRNKALEKEAISRERTTLWIIVSLIVVILLIIFVYAFNQHKLQHKLAIENTEKEKKNEQLSMALNANEALVQEISHRVKNNLAVLSGLLTMQAQRSGNDKVIKELQDSVLRIESIATIHKKLYDKRSDAKVNLKEAIYELSDNVLSAMGFDPNTCLDTKLDDCDMDIADAVTLCLILNEVITNCCKYADLSTSKKLIVDLENWDGKIRCSVIDHGPGFDMKEYQDQNNRLGLYLIKLLAKQLKAEVVWEKKQDEFIFRIQLEKNE